MTDAPKTDPVTTGPQPTQAPAFALVALLALGMGLHAFAWFMAIIVLPQIVQNFGGAESLHWTTTLYMAATILASAIAGPGMARHGSGRVLAAGAAVFILGALICGTAWSMVPFLVGRTLQGFGEGLVIGASFGLIRQIYPPDQVPKAFSLMGIVFASAALIAPILAGGLEAYFGWRSVFAFHGVLGLVVGAMALLLLPAPRYARDDPTRPPGPGLETILPSAVAGLGLLSIGLIPHLPEPWMGLGPLIALPLLCRAALKLDARSPAPLCPPGLFNPATPLGLGFWVVLLLPIGMGGIYSHVPTLVASGFRIDPILAGQATLLVALAWSASAWITSRVIKTPGSPEAIRAAPILLGLGLCLIALGFTDLVGTGLLLPASAIGLGMLLIGTAMGSSWGFLCQAIMALAPEKGVAEQEDPPEHPPEDPDFSDHLSALLPAVQNAGWVLGGGLAGIAGGLTGLQGWPEPDLARSAAPVIMLIGLPFVILALLSAWRFTANPKQSVPSPPPSAGSGP